MRGLVVFVVFFAIFSVSSFLISSPLFPGNVVCFLFNVSDMNALLLGVAVNGVFYGSVAWVVFVLSFRWVERSLSKNKSIKSKK